MSSPVRVLVVHGIGQERSGYARRLLEGCERAMRAALARLGARGSDAALVGEEALWDRYVHDQQARLQQALGAQVPAILLSGPLVQLLQRLAAHYLFRLRARLVPFVGDILAYQRPDAKRLITEELNAALARLAARAVGAPARTDTSSPPHASRGAPGSPARLSQEPGRAVAGQPIPLTVIGHSLGTVIASDFLWDARQRPGAFALQNFFTLGSPMAFYALRYGTGRVGDFDKPLAIAPPGCWVNCYHPNDPVATPLRRLNPAYAAAVLQDAEIHNRAFLSAHTSYWGDARVHAVIGEKLALDWARQNRVWAPDMLAARWTRYAERLKLD